MRGKKINILLVLLVLFFSCKTIVVTNKETVSKIIFKNLIKRAKEIEQASFSGSFKVTGVKEIPQTYISFKADILFKERKAVLSLSLFKKPILDIIFDQDKGILLNYTKKEFIRFNISEIDYSKIMGINFDPFEICYFFLGRVPYSSDMNLMDFNWTKFEYIVTLTNNISKYEIFLNRNQEIIKAKINNQFFDNIILESIKYTKNDDNKNVPNVLNFSSEDGKYILIFLIDKSSLKKVEIKSIDEDFLKDWVELKDIESIDIKIR